MLSGIEAFCAAHEHTIGALESVSTFLAVAVSLWLAHRATVADRTQLKASLQVATLFHPTIKPSPRFVVVSVTNVGRTPLQVTLGFFRWSIPLRREQSLILPIDSAGLLGVIPQKTYPIEILPRTSETFYLSEASEFVKQMSGIKGEPGFLGRVAFFFKTATVRTSDGVKFRVKGDRTITWAASDPNA